MTVSDSLSLLFKNEWPWVLSSLFTKERWWENCSCSSLQKSDSEQITLVALYKRVTVSKSLLLLFTKKWQEGITLVNLEKSPTWVIYLWLALLFSNHKRCAKKNCSFYHVFDSFLLTQNRFSQKTKEWIPNPEKPVLFISQKQRSANSCLLALPGSVS